MVELVLETDRLSLRPIQPRDCPAIFQYCSDIDLALWMMRIPHPFTSEDAGAFVARVAEKQGEVWAITLEGHLIGMMGTAGAFGYWIGKPYWGQGFASEAAEAVLAYYFKTSENDAISASYMLENQRSARLLMRLGFIDCGPTTITSGATGQTYDGRNVVLLRSDRKEALQ